MIEHTHAVIIGYTRPKTLEDGNRYFLREQPGDCDQSTYSPVLFLKYDPCPAFVIIQDQSGKRRRCLRDNIWLPQTMFFNILNILKLRWKILY
jgi:hypothetical protein